jgi:hypothetical protein
MKKVALYALLLIVVGLGLSRLVSQTPEPDRPAGVTAERWVAINDQLGLRIEGSAEPSRSREPALEGQLMAKVGGVWVKVQLATERDALRYLPAR